MLAAGADGVRVGTRFVASVEADVHPVYTDALIAARPADSVYGRFFHVRWPEAPHRALRSAIEAAQAFEGETVGTVIGLDGTEMPVPRFGTGVADNTAKGEIAAMSLWAGESVGSVKRVRPAGDIVRELAERGGATPTRSSLSGHATSEARNNRLERPGSTPAAQPERWAAPELNVRSRKLCAWVLA